MKFLPNGALDTSFGTAGVVNVGWNAANFVRKVVQQSNGKFILFGSFITHSFPNPPGGVEFSSSGLDIARLNADGTLDTSFGTNGLAYLYFYGVQDLAQDMVVAPDDSIFVLGSGLTGAQNAPSTKTAVLLAKFTSQGILDVSYGDQGKFSMVIGTSNYPAKLALQADGKVVAAGTAFIPAASGSGSNRVMYVIRTTESGVLDPNFGEAGTVTMNFRCSTNTMARGLFIEGTAIKVFGTIQKQTRFSVAAAYFHIDDGRPHESYGHANGKEIIPISQLRQGSQLSILQNAVPDANGGIISLISNPSYSPVTLARIIPTAQTP